MENTDTMLFAPAEQDTRKKTTFNNQPCYLQHQHLQLPDRAGRLHKSLVTVVDFQEYDQENHEKTTPDVVLHFHGIGGSTKKVNTAFASGNLDSIRDTLEGQAVLEAAQKKGYYVQVQLQEFPVIGAEPSFKEDAIIAAYAILNQGIDLAHGNVTINGYSEGAGVAREVAELVQELQYKTREIEGDPDKKPNNLLRLFSLTGTVPVKRVSQHFSQHIWDVVMAEAAVRTNRIVPHENVLSQKPATLKDQLKLIGIVAREVVKYGLTKNQTADSNAWKELTEAINGNLPLLGDVVARISKDFPNTFRQLQKFSQAPRLDLADNWTVELRIPSRDEVYPLQQIMDHFNLNLTGHENELYIWNTIFLKSLLDNKFYDAKNFTCYIYGKKEVWHDDVGSHIGPTSYAHEMYYGTDSNLLLKIIDRVEENKRVVEHPESFFTRPEPITAPDLSSIPTPHPDLVKQPT